LRKATSLFAKKLALLVAKKPTFLIAKKPTLLVAAYKGQAVPYKPAVPVCSVLSPTQKLTYTP